MVGDRNYLALWVTVISYCLFYWWCFFVLLLVLWVDMINMIWYDMIWVLLSDWLYVSYFLFIFFLNSSFTFFYLTSLDNVLPCSDLTCQAFSCLSFWLGFPCTVELFLVQPSLYGLPLCACFGELLPVLLHGLWVENFDCLIKGLLQ